MTDNKDGESANRGLRLTDLGGDRGAGAFFTLLRDERASADLHRSGIICPSEAKG